MPAWSQLLDEIKAAGSVYDTTRRKYISELQKHTGRNVIVYYSGWLQKGFLSQQGFRGFEINDLDKNGFMAAVHELDRDKGLDLLLHTPGGETAATESIVDYLRRMFGTNLRAIVPQLAMSAGTMIACACKDIVMGKQSSLGPIDPQIAGLAAHGIIEEFTKAHDEIALSPMMGQLWAPLIAKYTPTLIGESQKSIAWSEKIVQEWLVSGMFDGKKNAKALANKVIAELGSHALTLSHARHISIDQAKALGLSIVPLEDDPVLQDLVLTVHHCCMITLQDTPAVKIIENHLGRASIMAVQVQMTAKQQ